jgi:hypothetical protein
VKVRQPAFGVRLYDPVLGTVHIYAGSAAVHCKRFARSQRLDAFSWVDVLQ